MKKVSGIAKLRELCQDPREKAELFAELQAASDAKHQACVVDGVWRHDVMLRMIEEGRW